MVHGLPSEPWECSGGSAPPPVTWLDRAAGCGCWDFFFFFFNFPVITCVKTSQSHLIVLCGGADMKLVSLLIFGEAGPKRRLIIRSNHLTIRSRQMRSRGWRERYPVNSHGTGVPALGLASCSAFPRAGGGNISTFSWCHLWEASNQPRFSISLSNSQEPEPGRRTGGTPRWRLPGLPAAVLRQRRRPRPPLAAAGPWRHAGRLGACRCWIPGPRWPEGEGGGWILSPQYLRQSTG